MELSRTFLLLVVKAQKHGQVSTFPVNVRTNYFEDGPTIHLSIEGSD